MIELKMDVLIDRPRPEVFDFLSDPANLPRWNSVIQSAQWTTFATAKQLLEAR